METRAKAAMVEVPEDLLWALDANSQAQAMFNKFSSSHRKEYVRWIESARRANTRAQRVQEALEMIVKGKNLS